MTLRAAPAVLLCLGILALPVAARADLRREFEPDDTTASAVPLLPPVSVGGRIEVPGDRDVFAMRVKGGATIQASILARGFRADTAPGSSLTARLSILSTDGVSVLAQDVSQGGFDDPALTVQVTEAGTYYVEVEDLDGLGGPDFTYILSIELEPNGDFATAAPILPPVLPSIDSLIWPAGDHDVYRFDAVAGQTASIEFDSAVFNPNAPAVKGVMTLYAPDRSVLASAAYSVANPNDPYLQVTLPVTGTYFIDVHDLRGFVGGPTSVYQLSLELGPAATNDAAAAAEPAALPRAASGILCPAGDRDEMRVTLPAPATLVADLDAREDLLSLLTGTVSILDVSGAVLETDSSTPDPVVSAPLPAGDAVVAVQGASGGLCQDAYWQVWLDADLDGDGLRLPHDNCPGAANPAQQDFDGDGVGDACDDCVAVFNPGQEPNLRIQEPVADTLALAPGPGGTLLQWVQAPGSIASNVYRDVHSRSGTQPSYACRADNLATASFFDPDLPPLGSAFFYVVTGENCGESGAGSDSTGAPVIVDVCPVSI